MKKITASLPPINIDKKPVWRFLLLVAVSSNIAYGPSVLSSDKKTIKHEVGFYPQG